MTTPDCLVVKRLENCLFQSYIAYNEDKTLQKRRRTYRARTGNEESIVLSDHTMKSAILLLSGPVCTIQALCTHGPKKCRRRIRDVHYRIAAKALEQANLGSAVASTHGGSNAKGLSLVFIKKPPEEISTEQLKEFCTIEKYTENYYRKPPASILQKWRQKLITLGLVPEEHFKLTT